MGTWGAGTFDNDSAADFSAEFEEADREEGLELIAGAIDDVLAEEDYLDSDFAVNALVACEAIARLAGQGGELSSYSEALDEWVESCPGRIDPDLTRRALQAIDRIMGPDSKLPELREGSPDWLAAIDDLERRVTLALG